MLIFEWKVEKQSKSWCFSAIRWELIKILKFEFNTAGSIKMLKFERKRGDWSNCWYFLAKVWIDQNVGIWLQNKELIRILKLRTKLGMIDQNKELIRILKLRTKLGINQNVEIWVLTTKSFKMLYFVWKVGNQSKSWHLSAIRCELIKMLKFECKMSNRSKCWNLSEKGEIDQMLVFYCKLLEFDWKIRNWSEYWNLKTTLRIH